MRSSARIREYAYLDGRIIPVERANISIKTHAFNYGTCAFEGMKAFYLGRGVWNLHRVNDHVERMLRTSRGIMIDHEFERDQIASAIEKLVLKNGWRQDTYVRPMIFCSRLGLGLGRPTPARLGIFCQKVRRNRLRELPATISEITRVPHAAIPFTGKVTGVYVNSYIAQRKAAERDGGLAILLDVNRRVTEAFGMNLSVVKGRKIITAPVEAGVLDGITRKSVFELLESELKMEVEEKLFGVRTLYSADEIFTCGTGGGINSITSIDGRKIGSGKRGKVTVALSELYNNATRIKLEGYERWGNRIGG